VRAMETGTDVAVGNFWVVGIDGTVAEKRVGRVRSARVRELLPEVDFLFLDGDHSYARAKQDWEWYAPLVRPGGIIALHDIAPTPAGSPVEVHRLWREIRAGPYRTEEIVADPEQQAFGIGVVFV
jgi:predicted O-methyltransferase YrrM